MSQLIHFLNNLLWQHLLVYLLLATGIWFSIRLKLLQFSGFSHAWKLLTTKNETDERGISSFQALMTSLAARVGTGNLAGVAIAISVGGAGAIFWMWIIALLGMATGFAESVLGQAYKVTDNNGEFRGGPAYYIKQGLNLPWLASLFSICLFIGYGFVFSSVQANTISQALANSYHFPAILTGLVIIAIAAVIILKGVHTIAKVSAVLVPVMGVCYLLLAIVICVTNISQLPMVLKTILHSAFGLEQAAGGAFGAAIVNGIKRGLYSNEAGAGTVPHAAAAAAPNPPHPVVQGYVQMLGVFIDTIVVCSATAFIILLSPDIANGKTGIELTQQAMNYHIGNLGEHFVALAIVLFSFTSIIANYVYAESNLHLFKLDNKLGKLSFTALFLATTLLGTIASLPDVWALADLSLGLMTLINCVALFLLTPTIIKLTAHYRQQTKQKSINFSVKERHLLQSELFIHNNE